MKKEIEKEFKKLLKAWGDQEKEFKDKYRPYKSKYLKNKKDPNSDGISYWKKVEMLEAAGKVEIRVIAENAK